MNKFERQFYANKFSRSRERTSNNSEVSFTFTGWPTEMSGCESTLGGAHMQSLGPSAFEVVRTPIGLKLYTPYISGSTLKFEILPRGTKCLIKLLHAIRKKEHPVLIALSIVMRFMDPPTDQEIQIWSQISRSKWSGTVDGISQSKKSFC